jgi:hypothetical protein
MTLAADDPEARLMAFAQGLQELGWNVGGNIRIESCWGRAMPTVGADMHALLLIHRRLGSLTRPDANTTRFHGL